MADKDFIADEDDDVERRHPDDPGEVPTRFTTVGQGWSGREEDEEDS